MSACAGKKRFRDRIAAELALSRIDRRHGTGPREKEPVRSYRCGTCKGWHLTSMPMGGAA